MHYLRTWHAVRAASVSARRPSSADSWASRSAREYRTSLASASAVSACRCAASAAAAKACSCSTGGAARCRSSFATASSASLPASCAVSLLTSACSPRRQAGRCENLRPCCAEASCVLTQQTAAASSKVSTAVARAVETEHHRELLRCMRIESRGFCQDLRGSVWLSVPTSAMALADRRLEAASARTAARSAAACWACCRAAALALAAFCWAAASRAWDAASAFSSCACNQPCTALAEVPSQLKLTLCLLQCVHARQPRQPLQTLSKISSKIGTRMNICTSSTAAADLRVARSSAQARRWPSSCRRALSRASSSAAARACGRDHMVFFQQKANIGKPLHAVTSCRDIPSRLSFEQHWRRKACTWRRCGWQSKYAGLGAGNNDRKMRT